MSKTLIFLDCDGVLCDSVKEAYLLTRFAYKNTDVKQPIDEENYQMFHNYRFLVANSWQYYILADILENFSYKNADFIEARYKYIVSQGKTDKCDEFNKKFLGKRKELMEQDFEFWNGLETPTNFLQKLKNIIAQADDSSFAILSTKNKDAIIKKFNFWGVEFDSDLIFDKKDLENLSKGEFIKRYLDSHSDIDEAILIDDNEDNINSCANIENLKACLTSWGYLKSPEGKMSEDDVLKIIKESV